MKIEPVRAYALSLPDVIEAPHHQYWSFRVGGKIFVTIPPGGQHIHVFVAEEQRTLALVLAPECTEKLVWAEKVVGLRVQLTNAQPTLVKDLIRQAWGIKSQGARTGSKGN